MVNNKDTADAAMEAAFEIYRKQNAGVGGDYSMRVDFEAGYNAAMNRECVWTWDASVDLCRTSCNFWAYGHGEYCDYCGGKVSLVCRL